MTLASARSKFYFYNSMVCLLKALEGKEITVEMRNDVLVEGRLEFAESTMNLTMSHVTVTNVKGQISMFSKFFIKGRHILFVQIPDDVDVTQAMTWQIQKEQFFKDKERKLQTKTFQRIQRGREKTAAKLNRQERL